MQILADYLRILAIQRYSDQFCAGWVVDLDTVWLRSIEMHTSIQQAATLGKGHVFGSMHASSKFQGSAEAKEQFFKRNFLVKPGDKLYLATPFRVPTKSEFAVQFVKRFEAEILQSKRTQKHIKDYNSAMHIFRGIMHQLSLVKAVLPPSVMSPLNYELKARVLQKSQPEWEKQVSFCVAVNNFWQSSRNPVSQDLTAVKKSSIWDQVLSKAFVTRLHFCNVCIHVSFRFSCGLAHVCLVLQQIKTSDSSGY